MKMRMVKEVGAMLVALFLVSYISAGIAITVVEGHVDKHHKVEITCP